MKQFNLKEYLENSSRKIVTRDGRKVRIVCTDKNGSNPIVALVTKYIGVAEDVYLYTKNGEICESISTDSDLFFAPEKREGWVNLYRNASYAASAGCVFTSEKEAKESIYSPSRYVTTIKIEWEE